MNSVDRSKFCQVEDPRFILSIDYTSDQNFIGRPIKGYNDKVCLLSHEAAQQLIKAQDFLDAQYGDICFKIFDAYRPQMAVDDFKAWVEDDSCQKMKPKYYPDISKQAMVEDGYLGVVRSTHTRGSTIDLTLCRKTNAGYQELDMGTCFDYFSEESHTNSAAITDQQKQNRKLLVQIMEQHGFSNFPLEWWHFTLDNEPFPDTYFNFPVEKMVG